MIKKVADFFFSGFLAFFQPVKKQIFSKEKFFPSEILLADVILTIVWRKGDFAIIQTYALFVLHSNQRNPMQVSTEFLQSLFQKLAVG